jgi:inorganic triphosphatase YgiF
MEIEAKLAAKDRRTFSRLASRRRLDAWSLDARRPERLESVYLDSPSGAFGRARIGCRVRRRGRAVEATVKSGGDVRRGIHRRDEWTLSLAAMPRFPWRLPAGLARRLPASLRGLSLEPILRTSIRRRRLLVRRKEGAPVLAEIALDEVEFRAPGRRGARRELEVEVELREGEEADLAAIVRAVRAGRVLRPSRGSKLERGLRWARKK